MINRVKVLYKRGGILAAILMSCMVFTTQPVCAGEAEQTGEIHLKYTPVQEAISPTVGSLSLQVNLRSSRWI